ncbi:unnamed protein product [Penicillium olsonii]|nr:unnamed protein product [Penicillium olsonii]CAG7929700.1 unnamed protein product [Penicillium olsonii]
MHSSVKEVLPGVDNGNRQHELQGRDEVPIDEACSGKLPSRESGHHSRGPGIKDQRLGHPGIRSTGNCSGQHCVAVLGDGLRKARRIHSNKCQR